MEDIPPAAIAEHNAQIELVVLLGSLFQLTYRELKRTGEPVSITEHTETHPVFHKRGVFVLYGLGQKPHQSGYFLCRPVPVLLRKGV